MRHTSGSRQSIGGSLVHLRLRYGDSWIRNRDGEDVLHPPSVYLHTKAGEGVCFHGQGRFKFDLKDHRAFGQTDDDVRTPANQGLITSIPPSSKSSMSLVATDAPRLRAIAATW